jgi:serine/threonine kinase PknH
MSCGTGPLEDPIMAKFAVPDSVAAASTPIPPISSGSRLNVDVPTPSQFVAAIEPGSGAYPGPPVLDPGLPPKTDSLLLRLLKRTLLFWRAHSDVVQVSVFGPPALTPGQSAKISVYLHTPQTADSVRTLGRAFHPDAELIGVGYVSREVARATTIGVHLSVTNAGISKSLQTFAWHGQPHRLLFDLHIPWESPAGPVPGLVSIGVDNIRIGKIDCYLYLLPRKG